MAELDVAEDLFGAENRDGFLGEMNTALGEANAEASLNNLMTNDFPSMAQYFDKVELNADNEPELIDKQGNRINLKEVQDDFSSGRIDDAFSKVFGDDLSPDLDNLAKEEKLDSDASRKGQIRESDAKVKEYAQEFGDDPVSEEDFKAKVADTGFNVDEADAEVERIKGDATSADDPELQKRVSESEWGKRLAKLGLRVAVIALGIWLAKSFFDFIGTLKHVLSGCWANTDSDSCKIPALTCNDADLAVKADNIIMGKNDFQLCTACSNVKDQKNCGWIPLQQAKACNCDPSKTFPGAYNWHANTGNNPCVDGTNAKCPIHSTEKYGGGNGGLVYDHHIEEKYGSGNGGLVYAHEEPEHFINVRDASSASQYACSTASGCVARKEACPDSSATCSDWCSNKNIVLMKGQSLSCRKCGFWCAFGHVTGLKFPKVADVLGKVEKWLIYIAIGIVVLIIGYILLKELFHGGEELIEGGGGESSGADHTIHIKVSAQNGAKIA